MVDQVKEGTTAYLTVTFKDKDGAPQTPSSADYRIDNLTTKKVVLASTNIPAPGNPQEIVITSTQNKLHKQKNSKERFRVTVVGNYGAGDAAVDFFDYEVINTKEQ